jgi:RNA polymerase sigma-70 factor (ECF subfamily)
MPETPSDDADSPKPNNTTSLIGGFGGNREEARDKLIDYAYARLRRLARRMLRNYPSLRLQVESGDVLHPALLRLRNALMTVTPESSRHFWNLAALNIRRELLNLARKYATEHKARVCLKHEDAEEALGKQEDAIGPSDVDGWARFHQLIDDLPEREREVFYLVWYDWLTQEQTADVLGVSLRTVRRLWLSARLKMTSWMCGERLS